MKLLALVVSEEFKITHVRNASTTVGPLEPHCLGQGAKTSNMVAQEETKPLNRCFQNYTFGRIGWIVIEKSRTEHDPKFTRLYDLLPTGSSFFYVISGRNVKTIEGCLVSNFLRFAWKLKLILCGQRKGWKHYTVRRRTDLGWNSGIRVVWFDIVGHHSRLSRRPLNTAVFVAAELIIWQWQNLRKRGKSWPFGGPQCPKFALRATVRVSEIRHSTAVHYR